MVWARPNDDDWAGLGWAVVVCLFGLIKMIAVHSQSNCTSRIDYGGQLNVICFEMLVSIHCGHESNRSVIICLYLCSTLPLYNLILQYLCVTFQIYL